MRHVLLRTLCGCERTMLLSGADLEIAQRRHRINVPLVVIAPIRLPPPPVGSPVDTTPPEPCKIRVFAEDPEAWVRGMPVFVEVPE
jgi:hypothetical protein